MDNVGRAREWESSVLIRWLLILPTAVFGALTVVTHAARFLQLSFQLYAWLSAALALGVSGLWAFFWRRERTRIGRRDRKVLALVLAAGVLGAGLASIYRLPDMDDFAYVPDAVHFLTFPAERMGYTIHYGYFGPKPIFTIVEATAQPFEYVQALAAGALHVEYLTVYYILSVAFIGFCIPLALFLLLSHFTDDTWHAALAMLVVLGLLTLMGETKHAPGGWSFTTLFKGKTVLVALGVPLFIALSLDYLAAPGVLRWVLLAACGAAAAGLSTTGFFLFPMLALAIGAAHFIASDARRQTVLAVMAYGASLFYLVGYALYASRAITHLLGAGTTPLSEVFRQQLFEVFDLRRPVTPVVFGMALLIVAALLTGYRRRFLLSWAAIAALAFLNPIVAPFWMTRVTGTSIYWRAYFVLPLTALAGAAWIALLERLPARRPRLASVLTAFLLGACLVFNLIPGSTSIYRRGGEIGWPAYKLVDEAVRVGRAVVAQAPPGVMLAPREISGTTPMLRGGYPQLRIRDDTLIAWLTGLDRAGEADRRIQASEFTNGRTEYLGVFERVVADTEVLTTIVLRLDVFPLAEAFLREHGFTHQAAEDGYLIVWR
jgi:hypothetical protein